MIVNLSGFSVEQMRKDFPILAQAQGGRTRAYLDNAATTQKPRAVVERLMQYYYEENANVHRGVHDLSQRASEAYEAVRDQVQRFLNAAQRDEIVFVKGTTEAINLVAESFSKIRIQPGDEIILSVMEHHANIVPWQLHAVSRGAVLRVVPIDERGDLILEEYARMLGPRTKLVALTHVSNTLGTINDAMKIVELARQQGVPVLLDGAQAVSHMSVDVQALGCDFYVFSGHKLFGPTGIGVLYMRSPWLEQLPPYQGGGDMIESVSFEKTTFKHGAQKFEAGTPDIAGVIGLGAALDYLQSLDSKAIHAHEEELLHYATERLDSIPGLHLVGRADNKVPVLSFTIDGAHPHDVGTILDHASIAVRTGHHCTQPLMRFLKIPGTTRASLAFYNTREEVDQLAAALPRIVTLFQ